MIYLVYPLIVTLLWCFNTVLYLWSSFIQYLSLLCYIIYIQSKSYVNVCITLKFFLLKNHEILLISVNWHLIGYINIAMICHLPHAYNIKSIGVKCIGTWLWLTYQTVRLAHCRVLCNLKHSNLTLWLMIHSLIARYTRISHDIAHDYSP